MTDADALERARAVLAGKSRGLATDADELAQYVIELHEKGRIGTHRACLGCEQCDPGGG